MLVDDRRVNACLTLAVRPFIAQDAFQGLGEVVIVGVAPAIANAVSHATGRRVRELPITAEALL